MQSLAKAITNMSIDILSKKKKKKRKTSGDPMTVVESTEWIHLNFTECFCCMLETMGITKSRSLIFLGTQDTHRRLTVK